MPSIYGTQLSYGQGLGQSLGTQAATNTLNFPFAVAGNLLNYHLHEKAADNADERQRAQFRDMYSIQAQMKQLKDAGLSPSLMYGEHQAKGCNSPQGHGAYGTQALATISPMEVAQVQKTDAERRLIEEEIENKKADTKNKGQEFLNLIQSLNNAKVKNRILVAQADLAECNADLSWSQYMANLEQAYYNSQKASAEARSADVKADLDESTFDAAYQQAWAELNKTLAEGALAREEINLTKEQVKEIGWNIWQINKQELRADKQFNQDINNMKNYVKLELMKLNQGAEKIIADVSQTKINAVAHIVGCLFNFGGTAYAAQMYSKINQMPRTTTQERYGSHGEYLGETITHSK